MSSQNSGPQPFGYIRLDGRLVANEPETKVRRLVFELFQDRLKKSTVAQILNAEGHRTRSGTIFSAQTIGRILADPIVLGVPGEVEQIVDQELWDRCQDILAEQKSKGGAKRSARHLFAGLLHCSCGQKMYVPTSSKKYVCGDCRAKVVKSDLETVFVERARQTAKDQSAQTALKNWYDLPFSTKREIIETLLDRVDANDKSLTLHFAAL